MQNVDSLCGVFSVLERPPPLLDLLDDSLLQPPLLQLPVEVLDVEGRELLVGHADAKDVLGPVPRHAAVVRHGRLGRPSEKRGEVEGKFDMRTVR